VSVPLDRACGDLLELLRAVTDGRRDQGRDHPVAAVLALAAAATVAGMTGCRAIAGWIADVPTQILADLYLRAGAAKTLTPGRTTIWRVLSGSDADALDAAIGTWLTTSLPAGGQSHDESHDAGNDAGPPGQPGTGLTHLRLDAKPCVAPKTATVTSGICWLSWPARRARRWSPRRPKSTAPNPARPSPHGTCWAAWT
jgi:hypothetical protein